MFVENKHINSMKFTKEDAYKELVKQMTATGETLQLSERSINAQLETLMPLLANDETELSAFIASVLPVYKVADANIRHDVSSGIADFKKNYQPTPPKKDGEGDPNAELIRRLTELEDKLKASETKETIQGLKNSFIAKAKEKGVKHEDWLKDYANEITFSENLDVDAKVDACLKFYNKSLAVVKTDTTPKQGGGSTDSKLISDIIASAAAQAKAEN